MFCVYSFQALPLSYRFTSSSGGTERQLSTSQTSNKLAGVYLAAGSVNEGYSVLIAAYVTNAFGAEAVSNVSSDQVTPSRVTCTPSSLVETEGVAALLNSVADLVDAPLRQGQFSSAVRNIAAIAQVRCRVCCEALMQSS